MEDDFIVNSPRFRGEGSEIENHHGRRHPATRGRACSLVQNLKKTCLYETSTDIFWFCVNGFFGTANTVITMTAVIKSIDYSEKTRSHCT